MKKLRSGCPHLGKVTNICEFAASQNYVMKYCLKERKEEREEWEKDEEN